jgi:hypothetical protein
MKQEQEQEGRISILRKFLSHSIRVQALLYNKPHHRTPPKKHIHTKHWLLRYLKSKGWESQWEALLTVAVEANVHHGENNGAPRPFPPPRCSDQKTAAGWKKHKQTGAFVFAPPNPNAHQTLILGGSDLHIRNCMNGHN